MNHINLSAGKTTGLFAVLLAGLVGVSLAGSTPVHLIFFLCWTWALICVCLYIKTSELGGQVFVSAMYLFIATTFLNQSLLSVQVGFFSLFIYRLMLIVALIILLVKANGAKGLHDLWDQIYVKGILFFLLFWMAYGGISLLWAQSVIDGVKYLFLLGIGIAFIFLAVFSFTKIRQLTVFYAIWMFMTAALLVIGLVNHFTGFQLPTSSLYGGSVYKLDYPTAVFTNQNDFATLLTISFFFYLSYAKNAEKGGYRVLTLALSALSLYIIFLTDSRASLLAIAAGLAFYVFMLLPGKFRKYSAIAAAALLAGGVLLYSGKIVSKLIAFFTEEPDLSVYGTTDSNVVRIHFLQSTAHYLADTYGFGVGAGNLSYYLEYRPLFNTDHIYEVHNWLAEITGNFGILIGAGYLAMYTALFVSLYRMRQRVEERNQKMLIEGALAGQLAFLVSSISPSSVSNLYFHWVFLGFVVALVSVLQRDRRLNEVKPGGVKR